MILNRVKLGRVVTFIKYLASIVSLIFLPETLIWNNFGYNFSYQIYDGVHLTLPPHIFSIQVKSGACYITGQWERVRNKIKET